MKLILLWIGIVSMYFIMRIFDKVSAILELMERMK